MRHDACEWIYTLHDGCVTECRSYRNREYDCGTEPKENLRRLAAAFDTAIASARPERLPAELSLFVKFAADSTGRVVRIDRAKVTLREPQTAAGKGDRLTVDDPHDPLLAEAVRAFRAETRWKTWWINGAWKEQWYSLPLRRDGRPWQPPR